jgi:hypothetical protein
MGENVKYGEGFGWNGPDSKMSGCKLDDWCLIHGKDSDFLL